MRSDYRSADTVSRSRPRPGASTAQPVRSAKVRNDTTEPRRRRKQNSQTSATRLAIDRAAMSVSNSGAAANEARQMRAPEPPRQTPRRSDSASRAKQPSESLPKRRFSWPQFKLSGWVKYSLLALAVALLVAVSFMKPIDKSSESQVDSAMTRALIGFGIARTLNGVISVAQGTEFAVQPAGVGVNFSPGEILDPINLSLIHI